MGSGAVLESVSTGGGGEMGRGKGRGKGRGVGKGRCSERAWPGGRRPEEARGPAFVCLLVWVLGGGKAVACL